MQSKNEILPKKVDTFPLWQIFFTSLHSLLKMITNAKNRAVIKLFF